MKPRAHAHSASPSLCSEPFGAKPQIRFNWAALFQARRYRLYATAPLIDKALQWSRAHVSAEKQNGATRKLCFSEKYHSHKFHGFSDNQQSQGPMATENRTPRASFPPSPVESLLKTLSVH